MSLLFCFVVFGGAGSHLAYSDSPTPACHGTEIAEKFRGEFRSSSKLLGAPGPEVIITMKLLVKQVIVSLSSPSAEETNAYEA